METFSDFDFDTDDDLSTGAPALIAVTSRNTEYVVGVDVVVDGCSEIDEFVDIGDSDRLGDCSYELYDA